MSKSDLLSQVAFLVAAPVGGALLALAWLTLGWMLLVACVAVVVLFAAAWFIAGVVVDWQWRDR